ncbi:DUF488 family protein [Gordonia sp. DT218]|uniref:DUF488 domain-containing protein n=1 Tax=Gordonia sp. DT218 TaxID=3416659 RepID=UPI003CEA8551
MIRLLRSADVHSVVDVRRYPGSRNNPDARAGALARRLPDADIAYRTCQALGGRRRLDPDTPLVDTWWRVQQFAAYAAHTRTDEFDAGCTELLAEAARHRTAMMCSESVWWRCHRRLIADVATLVHNTTVSHLMHDGRLVDHVPADGARVRDDGHVVWDSVTR